MQKNEITSWDHKEKIPSLLRAKSVRNDNDISSQLVSAGLYVQMEDHEKHTALLKSFI